jgi:hypothetical protein
VWGGKIWRMVEGEKKYANNTHAYVLDLVTLQWRLADQ